MSEPIDQPSAESDESLLERLKDKAKEVQSAVADKLGETAEAAQDKLREKLDEVNQILPSIRELGYAVEAVQVGLGLLPEVGIDVSGLAKTMDEATYARVLERHQADKLTTVILKTLQTASAWQQKIQFMDLGCDQATITLGLPPKLTLKFTRPPA